LTTIAYKKTANAIWVVAIAVAVIMPDIIFGAVLELCHLLLEAAHLLFELVEAALDHLVEHHFHTGTKETQIIVFYIIMTMGLTGFFLLWRKLKQWGHALKITVQSFISDYKARFVWFWSESAHNKFKLIAGVNIALTVVYLVGF
jgi:hypothetical protein